VPRWALAGAHAYDLNLSPIVPSMNQSAAHPQFSKVSFHAIVEQSVAGIYVLQDECFVYTNCTWAAMLGYTADEMVGGHLSRFVPADFLGEVLRLYHLRLKADPPSIHFVTHGLHRAGHELRIEVHGSRIIHGGRPAVMGIGVDITERLRNELELQRSREQLRELTAYTQRKLDEQRLTFARDLHDVLGGMLTSIKMEAARVLRRVATDDLQQLTRGLIDLTQETIDTVKQLSEELRPSELDHLDLSMALARALSTFSERSGVKHTLSADASTLRLSPKRATAAFRIFHEALTNVARHAHANNVAVELRLEGDRLVLDMRDDGIGFDPARPAGSALGLLSMAERAHDIDADLSIESSPGSGTRLMLATPLL
jgi:two-component system sensor histidine kinase UhpB